MPKNLLRIFSLNTEYGKYNETLVPYIESIRNDFDIFCFQEVPNDAQDTTVFEPEHDAHLFEKFAKALPDFTPYYTEFVKGSFGIVTFVRDSLKQKFLREFYIFGNSDMPFLDKGKWNSASKAHILKIAGINIVNLHGAWQPKSKKRDTPERLIQSKILRKMTQGKEHKTVLIGDFNLCPDTQSIAILEKKYQNLIDLFDISATRTAVYDDPSLPYADYAFIGSELEVLDFQVHLEPIFSDHGFMTLTISG